MSGPCTGRSVLVNDRCFHTTKVPWIKSTYCFASYSIKGAASVQATIVAYLDPHTLNTKLGVRMVELVGVEEIPLDPAEAEVYFRQMFVGARASKQITSRGKLAKKAGWANPTYYAIFRMKVPTSVENPDGWGLMDEALMCRLRTASGLEGGTPKKVSLG